jgi:hypothetical protein
MATTTTTTVTARSIILTANRDEAFRLLEQMEISSRQKSTIRYQWKKKHCPDQIHDKTLSIDRVHRLEKRIDDLEKQLLQVMERIDKYESDVTNTDATAATTAIATNASTCFICGVDPEGYDLPCGHEICHPCFRQHLDTNGDMICKVCQKEFHFEDLNE